MMTKRWALIAVSTLALAACDAVRIPGDGREAPAPIPEGAPGPPPPIVPVNNPQDDVDDPIEIPAVDNSDPEPAPDEPVETEDPVEPPAEEPTEDPVDDPETPTDQPVDEPDEDPVSEEDPPSDPEPEPEEEPAVSPPPPPPPAQPVKFEYFAPGDLLPGSGFGRVDDTIYAPDMVFPIKSAPTFLNSQVYRPGGGVGGDQCDVSNYSYPWRDNFCETRTSNRTTPLCSLNKVHQGQDLRTGTASECLQMRAQTPRERGLHEAVAVEDGIIQYIGSYSLRLKGTETGFIYSYVHLNMRRLQVSELDTVKAGDVIGVVSNDFGGTPTTYHLHFEIKAPVEGEGIVHVPPYMSLVSAYERREGGVGKVVEDETVAVASAIDLVDPSWLID